MKPIIGITAVIDDDKKIALLSTYVEAINNAGGIAFIIPYIADESLLKEHLEACDGILFSGGCDVHPSHFGEQVLPECGVIQHYRDEYELTLFKLAYEKKMPILGICRGCQVINIALGGTLYQDIPSQYKTDISHRQSQPKTEPSHDVNVIESTPLFELVGKTRMTANSFHHQAIKDVADGLCVMARADDGIIEALYGTNDIYIRAYQWHPERLEAIEKCNHAIFVDFIDTIRSSK